MKGPRTFLRSSEWLVTGSLLIFFFAMVVISKIKALQTGSLQKQAVVMVDVLVDGYVKKPGIYTAALGTPIQAILKKASPKKNADLYSLPQKLSISHPLTIHVEPLKELSIHIEGEVQNSGLFHVACGTRISDLKRLVSPSSATDLSYFKKRRLLQDGETIRIPSIDILHSHNSLPLPD